MNLKKWMKENGINSTILSKMLEKSGVIIDRTTIIKYTNGIRTPRLKTALAIEKITLRKVTCKELLGK